MAASVAVGQLIVDPVHADLAQSLLYVRDALADIESNHATGKGKDSTSLNDAGENFTDEEYAIRMQEANLQEILRTMEDYRLAKSLAGGEIAFTPYTIVNQESVDYLKALLPNPGSGVQQGSSDQTLYNCDFSSSLPLPHENTTLAGPSDMLPDSSYEPNTANSPTLSSTSFEIQNDIEEQILKESDVTSAQSAAAVQREAQLNVFYITGQAAPSNAAIKFEPIEHHISWDEESTSANVDEMIQGNSQNMSQFDVNGVLGETFGYSPVQEHRFSTPQIDEPEGSINPFGNLVSEEAMGSYDNPLAREQALYISRFREESQPAVDDTLAHVSYMPPIEENDGSTTADEDNLVSQEHGFDTARIDDGEETAPEDHGPVAQERDFYTPQPGDDEENMQADGNLPAQEDDLSASQSNNHANTVKAGKARASSPPPDMAKILGDQFGYPTVYCMACGDLVVGEPTLRASCGHDICVDCVQDLVRSSIRDEQLFPPQCCRQPFTQESMAPFLGVKLQAEFDAKRVEFDVPAAYRMFCPRETCSAFIGSSEVATIVLCSDCGTMACASCRQIAHPGETCTESASTASVKKLAKENQWQTCPQCHAIVEKTEGCNHMTCRCRSNFCYRCGGPMGRCNCG